MSERQASPWNWQKVRGFVLPILVIALLGGAVLYLAPGRDDQESLADLEAESIIEPAMVEPFGESGFNWVVLTELTAERLDIQTALVSEQEVDGEQRLVIPYAAVLYGLNAETWVYVSPETLTYIRDPITVEYIEGDIAILTVGPPVGTKVVVVGVPELYGADTGVGK